MIRLAARTLTAPRATALVVVIGPITAGVNTDG